MRGDLGDLDAFAAVARAGGFREAARVGRISASGLSAAVRRLEERLGARLLHRTTRSITPTEAGRHLLERLGPALAAVDDALDAVAELRDGPSGTLKINVPMSVARLVLPAIVPAFLAAHPGIRLEVVTDESFVDIVAEGCDAGIRYDERLERDVVAVPIGPRRQRGAAAASPGYLQRRGRPHHPRDLLTHACLRARFPSGTVAPWEFERGGQSMVVDPSGPLMVRAGGGSDLAVAAAAAGAGIVYLFEEWLKPSLDAGVLEPVLEDWWPSFSGPFLYYPGRRLIPPPLRAFVDFIKAGSTRTPAKALDR